MKLDFIFLLYYIIMNKRERQKFLKKSGKRDLNKYLKLIKRISQKGGKYRKMYTDDLKFLIKQRGGGCIEDIKKSIEDCKNIKEKNKVIINNLLSITEQNIISEMLYAKNNNEDWKAELEALELEAELEAELEELEDKP